MKEGLAGVRLLSGLYEYVLSGNDECRSDKISGYLFIVYPMVRRKCDMMDASGNPGMYPYPSYEMIEKMIDELYGECKKQHPEMFKKYRIDSAESETEQYYGPQGLFRGLLGILLIRELLDRRRFRPMYGFGYGYGLSPYGIY